MKQYKVLTINSDTMISNEKGELTVLEVPLRELEFISLVDYFEKIIPRKNISIDV